MRKFLFTIVIGIFLSCAKEPVKIGVVVPLTGSASSYGKMCVEGIKLAAEILNEKGGILGRRIELIIKDDEGIKEKAKTAVEELDKEGVVVVIGPLTTENVDAVSEYVEKAKLPVVTPTATGEIATKGKKYIWRIAFTDIFQGISLAKFVKNKLGIDSVAIIMNPYNTYSVGLAESFDNEMTSMGGTIVYKGTFKEGDVSFIDLLKLVEKYKPKAIFLPVFYNEAGRIIAQARDLGMTQPFIGGDGLDSPELITLIGNRKGVNYYSTHFFYNYGGEEVQTFLHKFREKYGKEPQTVSALGYDALLVVNEAFNEAKKINKEAFINNIGKVKLTGATGTIDFSTGRDPRRSLVIVKFEPGTPTEVVAAY